ncbi:MAG: HAMP domain-containing sensor histidine kinase [Candidatus Saccharimonadales bacterium]
MEIKKTNINSNPEKIIKSHMRDYWDKFRTRTYTILTFVQCTFIFILFGILELLSITNVGWKLVLLMTVITSTIVNIIIIFLIRILGQPFHDLVQAILLVSGEPSIEKPPNPNSYDNNRDGFRDILQTVYELASNHDDNVESKNIQPDLDPVILAGLDNMTTGIVIIDKDKNIVYHNQHAPLRENHENKNEINIQFPDNDLFTSWLVACQKNKLSSEHQWVRVADKLPGEKDRRIFDVSANFHKNNAAETIVTFFDQTGHYMPEEDDMDFISFAAHELRGPITVIRGYLDVLGEELEDVLEQDQAELMQRLIVASNRLTSYVNNILNAARYDRRHMKLHLTEESVRHIYDSVADDMQMRANAQNRILVTDIPDNLPLVAADINSAGEVFVNLIDNAIKYSNEGGLVHVVAHVIPGFVEISIIDRGIGIPANVIANLFHKFYRSHRSRETVAGTGIGLYISKAIVSSHGGTITARSVENEGSTFSFTLPIYDTVADKLKVGNNSNVSLIEHGSGWIKNHSLYRG